MQDRNSEQTCKEVEMPRMMGACGGVRRYDGSGGGTGNYSKKRKGGAPTNPTDPYAVTRPPAPRPGSPASVALQRPDTSPAMSTSPDTSVGKLNRIQEAAARFRSSLESGSFSEAQRRRRLKQLERFERRRGL